MKIFFIITMAIFNSCHGQNTCFEAFTWAKNKKTGKFKYHHNSCIPDNYELMKRDSVIDCSKIEKDQKHYQMALENCRVKEKIKKKAGK